MEFEQTIWSSRCSYNVFRLVSKWTIKYKHENTLFNLSAILFRP